MGQNLKTASRESVVVHFSEQAQRRTGSERLWTGGPKRDEVANNYTVKCQKVKLESLAESGYTPISIQGST